jgi:hypothetical protein
MSREKSKPLRRRKPWVMWGQIFILDSAAKPPISGKMSRFPKENLNDFNNPFFQKSGEPGFCSRIYS